MEPELLIKGKLYHAKIGEHTFQVIVDDVLFYIVYCRKRLKSGAFAKRQTFLHPSNIISLSQDKLKIKFKQLV